jgi:DNA-binding transcriptional LysR family regulator
VTDAAPPLARLVESTPDLRSLALLVALDAHPSISRAAAAVGLGQPAATARLRALERRVGVPLVDRGARGSRLTPAGALAASWARELLDRAEDLGAGLASLRADRAARLRVAASLTIAEHLLPRWLATFAARHPSTVVTLEAMNSVHVEHAVLEGRADLGFVEGPGVGPGLAARDIARDRLVVVVAPDHPWAVRRTPPDAVELAATRFVQREPTSGTRTSFEAALAAAGAGEPAPPVLELSTTSAVRSAAAAGAGPAALSELTVIDDLAAGRLVAVPVSLDLGRTLRAVRRPGGPPSQPASALLSIALRGQTV